MYFFYEHGECLLIQLIVVMAQISTTHVPPVSKQVQNKDNSKKLFGSSLFLELQDHYKKYSVRTV